MKASEFVDTLKRVKKAIDLDDREAAILYLMNGIYFVLYEMANAQGLGEDDEEDEP